MPIYTQNKFKRSHAHQGPVFPQWVHDYLATGAPKGQRNPTLFAVSCQFRDAGISIDEAKPRLVARALADGLSEFEAIKAIGSAYAGDVRSPLGSNGANATAGPASNGTTNRSAPPPTPPPQQQQSTAPPPHPVPLPPPMPDGFRLLLEICFLPGEFVAIGEGSRSQNGNLEIDKGSTLPRERWIELALKKPLSAIRRTLEGVFVRVNPMKSGCGNDKDVTAFRHLLIEFDWDSNHHRIPKEIQYAYFLNSGLPISAITDSGNKSLQALVRLDAPDEKEYKRRREIVWKLFESQDGFDRSVGNPARYSRCPGVERNLYDDVDETKPTGKTGHQELLRVKVGAKSWDEWEAAQQAGDYTEAELDELTKQDLEYYRRGTPSLPKAMADEAFYGIAGEIVRLIEVQSEASREGILAQILVGLGNILGRGVRIKQSAWHFLNEFVVLVGKTSFGRKGTSWNTAQDLFEVLDPDWVSNRVIDGFQSGEAIVHEVRDPGVILTRKGKANDPGVTDKRLQIFEEEFGRFLMVAGRQGNTLSEITRRAWDARKQLNTKGKISPEKATEPHISLIGHVTRNELLKSIKELENQNGFSNRILWVATHRAKIVSNPDSIDWETDQPVIIQRLKDVIQTMSIRRELHWSPAGKAAWNAYYHSLKSSGSGVVGAIIGRSVAHVLRLTMIYTALDHSTLMEPPHLEAAKAFWTYCVRTARWLFGETTGDKNADRIYWALSHEPNGMTQTEISKFVFSRNTPSIDIEQSLGVLLDAELVTMKMEGTSKTQRPTKRWFAVDSQ